MVNRLIILGATGSIGEQALDVIRQTGCAQVVGLSTNTRIDVLENQLYEFKPRYAAVSDLAAYERLKARYTGDTYLFGAAEGVLELCRVEADMALNAIVGSAGLLPTLEVIESSKDLALANKESLVAGGSLVMKRAEEKGIKIYPVDSEHSAIYQCLQNQSGAVERLILTASGGPFRGCTHKQLEQVTVGDALKHPNWSMGRKITIDSATLMNKGFEVIEAYWLFGFDMGKIDVIVHPQSIIHSMVEFTDGQIIAQMGRHDMRMPIQYALNRGKREANTFPRLNLADVARFTFEAPDLDSFRCLKLAYDAMKCGGMMPAVMNAANEIAVQAFLDGKIRFVSIPYVIERTMDSYINVTVEATAQDIMHIDAWARLFAAQIVDREG